MSEASGSRYWLSSSPGVNSASRADSLRRCLEHQARDTGFPARLVVERDGFVLDVVAFRLEDLR